jgi:hypothetical protein
VTRSGGAAGHPVSRAGLDVVWRQFAMLFALGAPLFASVLACFRATVGTLA